MTGAFHIVVAMKPLDGNFADNAVRHGVAGLNVDACRVEYVSYADKFWKHSGGRIATGGFNPKYVGSRDKGKDTPTEVNSRGRWPANLIHDGSQGVMDTFPKSLRALKYPGQQGFDDALYSARFFFQVKEFQS